MADQLELVIGGGANRVLFRPMVRSHPHSSDYWDGNWIDTKVEIQAGSFRGAFGASFRLEELEAFRRDVLRLNDTIQGIAKFSSLEGQLEMTLTGDRLGHVEVAGRAQDAVGIGNVLLFSFDIDQSYLSRIASQVKAILERFPPIGRPEA